ncbi:hypothetical protein [Deinococcus navajonensis]|uniref:Uncharacterized protein n=1 Tax=Deinococcus navajonensis TaxID=309884 RepID=A0ABV8XQS3_9DEIO
MDTRRLCLPARPVDAGASVLYRIEIASGPMVEVADERPASAVREGHGRVAHSGQDRPVRAPWVPAQAE